MYIVRVALCSIRYVHSRSCQTQGGSTRGIWQRKVRIAISVTTVFIVATSNPKNRDFTDSGNLAMMFTWCEIPLMLR